MLCIYYAAAIFALLMFYVCDAQQKSYEESKQELELFDRMTANYDARIRPPTEAGTPVVVKIDLFLRNLGSVDDVRMEFSSDLLIRQTWNDTRLGFMAARVKGEFISLTSTLAERIWKPDVFFSLERQSSYHELLMPNRMLRLYPGGRILYSARITTTTHCHMSLSNYPFDIQTCNFTLGSFSYTDRDVRYEWRDSNAFAMREGIQGTQFVLTEMKPVACVNSHYTGNFSCLTVQFNFERQYGYHLVQIYVPTTLLVIVSWASFFLDVDATPARVTLGVTTLLTVSTQTTGIRSTLPPVSYTKAIDIWMAVCTALIFLALLEFAMVNLISRKLSEQQQQQRRRLPRTKTTTAIAALRQCIFRDSERKKENGTPLRHRWQTDDDNDATALKRHSAENKTNILLPASDKPQTETVNEAEQMTSSKNDDADDDYDVDKQNKDAFEGRQSIADDEKKKKIDYRVRAKLIDVACRVIFPLLFATFNVVYWITYFLLLKR